MIGNLRRSTNFSDFPISGRQGVIIAVENLGCKRLYRIYRGCLPFIWVALWEACYFPFMVPTEESLHEYL